MTSNFVDTIIESVEFIKHEEITFFCRTKKIVEKCPECQKNKRKFIRKFEYYDFEKQWLQTTTLRIPVCLLCFEILYYPKIVEQYYRGESK